MKKITLIMALSTLIFAGIGYYLYQKPPTSTDALKTDYELTATELFSQFEADEIKSNTKYLDKVIAVTGEVQEHSLENPGNLKITLDGGGLAFGVACQLENGTKPPKNYQKGQKVTLKGICTGMLMDVVLIRCVEILEK